jgi:dTDP-4-amino-4,6-dideoxygalactose transaminase
MDIFEPQVPGRCYVLSHSPELPISPPADRFACSWRAHRTGSLTELGCFSFYPGKNLGAYGEGGAVITSNPELAKTIRMLRDWGQSRRYHHDLRGFNYCLERLQGAILRVKLRHRERWTEARRASAAIYTELLRNFGVVTPQQMTYARHVYHVYAIRTRHREAMVRGLSVAGVQTGIHYPIPVHLQQAYRDPRFGEGDFPVSEGVAREVLSLPIFLEMQRSQIETVCDAVRSQLAMAAANV